MGDGGKKRKFKWIKSKKKKFFQKAFWNKITFQIDELNIVIMSGLKLNFRRMAAKQLIYWNILFGVSNTFIFHKSFDDIKFSHYY